MTEGILTRSASKRAAPGIFEIPRIASHSMSKRYRAACRRAALYAWFAQTGRRVAGLFDGFTEMTWPVRAVSGRLLYTVCSGAAAPGARAAANRARTAETADLPAAAAEPRRKSHARLNTALAFSAAGILFCTLSMYRVGLEVSLDGVPIGFVASQSVFEESVRAVSAKAGEILGETYSLHPDVSYRFTIVDKDLIFNSEEVESSLFAAIPDIADIYLLKVDGEVMGGARTTDEIDAVLERIMEPYAVPALALSDSADSAEFVERVEIERGMASASLLRTPDELYSVLTAPVRGEITHTLAAGETMSAVAGNYGLSVSALEELNPGVDLSSAGPGQTLLVQTRKTALSVAQLFHYSYTEPILFETEYVDDPAMWVGESKTLTEGVNGEMLFLATRQQLDGYSPKPEITGSVVLTAPVTQVIAQGSRTRNPTGTFIRPYGGYMSCNYGTRYIFGAYEFHGGIDLAGKTGDPIVASDGGTVTFAGEKSGYGLVVIISHGNGLTTYYGHCSKLLVKAGQKVGQGEVIAKLGSTGRSTGPHVHFEVRLNSVQQNPNKYVKIK